MAPGQDQEGNWLVSGSLLADWSAAGGLKVSRKLDDREIKSCWKPHFPEGAVSIGRQVLQKGDSWEFMKVESGRKLRIRN